jgi:hypothetical protein
MLSSTSNPAEQARITPSNTLVGQVVNVVNLRPSHKSRTPYVPALDPIPDSHPAHHNGIVQGCLLFGVPCALAGAAQVVSPC